jgi:DNA-binding PadR family transcriptional regulator
MINRFAVLPILEGRSMEEDVYAHLPLPNLPLHVLLALAEEDRHGWAIIKRIEELTEGLSSPSSGSLYLAMTRMEERRLIAEIPSPEEGSDARRRYYRITPLGRRVLEAETARLAQIVGAARAAGIREARG